MSALIATLREMSLEQYQYRDLLRQMVVRDFLLRYKQTVMGFGWAVFMPLINTLIFTVIFTRITTVATPVPYPLYAYCGLWAWNFFASSARFALTSLSSNSNLVTKVFFPREILPFSSVIVCLVDTAVGAILLIALMAFYGTYPGASVVVLPLVIVTHVTFTAAVSLIVAMANLFYRDVKYLFEVILTAWMFLTAVLYPVAQVGGTLGVLLRMNPLTTIIDGYRATLLLRQWPDIAPLSGTALVSFAFLVGAWLLFHRLEYQFAENV